MLKTCRIITFFLAMGLFSSLVARESNFSFFHLFFNKDKEQKEEVLENDIPTYQETLKKNPNDIKALLGLAQLYARVERNKEAIELYKRALALESDRNDIRILLAYAYFNNKEYEASRQLFEEALGKEPKNVFVLANLGQIAVTLQQYDQAEKYLTSALSIDPDNVKALTSLATLQVAQSHFEQAIKIYTKILSKNRANTDAQKGLAQAQELDELKKAQDLIDQGNYSKATQLYQQLLEKHPDQVEHLYAIARAYAGSNHTKEAILIYKKALETNPGRQDINISLGYAYLQSGDLSAGEAVFESLLKQYPHLGEALIGLGKVKFAQKDLESAKTYLKAALVEDPKNTTAIVDLAYIASEEEDYDEARRLYEQAFAVEPGNTRAQKGLSQLEETLIIRQAREYLHEENFQEAIRLHEYLIALAPRNPDYYLYLGNDYIRLKKFKKGIEILTYGLNLKPTHTDLRNALGFAYLRRGMQWLQLWPHYQWFWYYPYMFYIVKEDIYPRVDWSDICTSQRLFQQVLDQKPDDGDALAGLGRVAVIKDDKKVAGCLYAQALALHPDNTTVLAFYAALLAAEGHYYSSRKLYHKLVRLDPYDKESKLDYQDVINKSDPTYTLIGIYSQENEQDIVSSSKKAWTARLYDYGGVFNWAFALNDCLKVNGLVVKEYYELKNLLNQARIYSIETEKGGIGFSWNPTLYVSASAGCGFTCFSQYRESLYYTKPSFYIQPFLNLTYARKHHRLFIETMSDSLIVARNFTNNHAALVDRQFLRLFYEYDFGNRTLVGSTVANVWYINRIKPNQQQLGTVWFQLGVPCLWQNLVLRYQFIYGHFAHLTSDYYTYGFQTTHWTSFAYSKNWCRDTLVAEAGYGHAWQRGYEQGQVIVINPVAPFHIVNRQINAAYARMEYNPNKRLNFSLTATYTLDTFNYTTASVAGRFGWRF